MENASLLSTFKTARIIFFGIGIQSTLFSFWGLQFFITQSTPQGVPVMIYVVFSVMALLSFVYGIRFYQNYTRVKRAYLISLDDKKTKEALLLAYAIHILLLEFVSIIGIMVAIFTQKSGLIYPFYFLFLIGMWFSYPQKNWYEEFFQKTSPEQSL